MFLERGGERFGNGPHLSESIGFASPEVEVKSLDRTVMQSTSHFAGSLCLQCGEYTAGETSQVAIVAMQKRDGNAGTRVLTVEVARNGQMLTMAAAELLVGCKMKNQK